MYVCMYVCMCIYIYICVICMDSILDGVIFHEISGPVPPSKAQRLGLLGGARRPGRLPCAVDLRVLAATPGPGWCLLV